MTVLHFIDDKCSCSRFSEQHVSTLEHELNAAKHIRIQASDFLNSGFAAFGSWVIASPSVAVFNESGHLSYYGPYTDALLCNQGRDLVKQVIDILDDDTDYQWFNVLGYGCFCDWPESNKNKYN